MLPDKHVDITDHVFPWDVNRPTLLRMASADDLFLPVFSTIGKLRALMRESQITYKAIKRIHSPRDFIASLPAYIDNVRLRIIVDPTITEGRHVRYTEVYRAIH